MRLLTLYTFAAVLVACNRPAKSPEKAATVTNPVDEARLTTVTLSAEAEAQLALRTDSVRSRTLPATRTLGGEIVSPPGHSFALPAPVAAAVLAPDGGIPQPGTPVRRGQLLLHLVALPPDRDMTRAVEETSIAEARATQARQEAVRLEALAKDSLIPRRDLERAQADDEAARATLAAARRRLEQLRTGVTNRDNSALGVASPEDGVVIDLHVGAGQIVTAGAPLLTVARLDRLWVRVPIFVGEISRVDPQADAQVNLLQGDPATSSLPARRIQAPLTSDPLTSSSDLYFELGPTPGIQPGQRVAVTVPLRGEATTGRVVPLSAVLYDMHGGVWVYEKVGDRAYARRRVEIDRSVEQWAVLSRGPEVGVQVVTTGAAELFGTEFGPAKGH
jgi:RND family efflux transporter MFP subunit